MAKTLRNNMGNSFRMVFSESDGLPGLIIDKYNDYYVVQINSLGMDQHKETLYEVLIEEYTPKGIYEKADENLRKLEGLEQIDRIVFGDIPETVEIEQDGLKFLVDIMNGQKTGFFFDQRENRQRTKELAKGEILDCFCYTGGFSLYAAEKSDVTGIESSSKAIEYAKKNTQLNNLHCHFECADVFTTLRRFIDEKRKFDVIILDPPSFTKSKRKKDEAIKGYKEINLRAMQLLKEDGIILTCSCSYHISLYEFIEMLQDAATDTKKRFVIIHQGTQAKDHPVLLNFPESNYLKAIFLNETAT